MGRVTIAVDEREYDHDDRAALELLKGSLSRSPLEVMYSNGPRPVAGSARSDVGLAVETVAAISPMVEAAFRLLTAAVVKPQARGIISRKAHEWTDLVVAFALSADDAWLILGLHLPLAIAAGIRVSEIEALRGERLEELVSEDRQQVEFVRAVLSGTVTDELWKRQVTLLGSTRAVVEQVSLTLLCVCRLRMAQALGADGISNDDLDDLLSGYRDGRHTVPDMVAYERFYADIGWPRPAL
jgi:hypothetical protein